HGEGPGVADEDVLPAPLQAEQRGQVLRGPLGADIGEVAGDEAERPQLRFQRFAEAVRFAVAVRAEQAGGLPGAPLRQAGDMGPGPLPGGHQARSGRPSAGPLDSGARAPKVHGQIGGGREPRAGFVRAARHGVAQPLSDATELHGGGRVLCHEPRVRLRSSSLNLPWKFSNLPWNLIDLRWRLAFTGVVPQDANALAAAPRCTTKAPY